MQEEGGNPMAPLLRAVNRIAGTLGPTHPHLLFDTLAYEYTVNPPTKTLPASNVVIRVCLAGCNTCSSTACQEVETGSQDDAPNSSGGVRSWSDKTCLGTKQLRLRNLLPFG